MRFFNNKYRKICATCKCLNTLKDEDTLLTCPLKEVIEKLDKKEINQEDFEEYIFNNSCNKHQNFYYEPKKVKEIVFDEFEFNIQKENMTRLVRVCNPYDKDRQTFLGYNLGFIPAFPDLDSQEKDKLTVKIGCDLAFYLPELNIVVFNSESIWFPMEDNEFSSLPQITEEEVNYFNQNKENILDIFFPNLFKNIKEKELDNLTA